ncbi:hypothetical protein ACFSQ7_19545 [Paenibacillus rhizoplanae]
MQELRHVESAEDYGSAWRNGKRYTQQLGRMKVQSLPERDIRLREKWRLSDCRRSEGL